MAWSDAARLAAAEARKLHAKHGVGIGDMVVLHTPVNGMHFGQVHGFAIDPKRQGVGMAPRPGMGPASDTPFLGAKVSGVMVRPAATPFHEQNFNAVHTLPQNSMTAVHQYGAIDSFRRAEAGVAAKQAAAAGSAHRSAASAAVARTAATHGKKGT